MVGLSWRNSVLHLKPGISVITKLITRPRPSEPKTAEAPTVTNPAEMIAGEGGRYQTVLLHVRKTRHAGCRTGSGTAAAKLAKIEGRQAGRCHGRPGRRCRHWFLGRWGLASANPPGIWRTASPISAKAYFELRRADNRTRVGAVLAWE